MAIAGSILGMLGSAWLAFFGFAMILAFIGVGQAVDATIKELDKAQAVGADESVMSSEKADGASAEKSAKSDDSSSGQPAELKEKRQAARKSLADPVGEAPADEESSSDPKPMSASPQTVYRTWRSDDGKFSCEAEFLSIVGGKVKLRKKDGKIILVPPDRLSKEDVEWYKAELERRRRSP